MFTFVVKTDLLCALQDLLYRFKSVCPDADNNIDPYDQGLIASTEQIIARCMEGRNERP